MNNKIIGLNVKKFRKERHLTQEALAERLDISTVHMSHIEGGSVSMSLALLLQLCEALDIAPNQVLEGAYTLSTEKNKPASEDILKGLHRNAGSFALNLLIWYEKAGSIEASSHSFPINSLKPCLYH